MVYGVPVWMAEAIDAEIDGAATTYGATATLTGPANTGRVRLWKGTVATPVAAGAAGAAMTYDNTAGSGVI